MKPKRLIRTLRLEATEYAKLKGVGEEFHMAAYEAYWREGVDLGKVENLKPIGESVGLDWSVDQGQQGDSDQAATKAAIAAY